MVYREKLNQLLADVQELENLIGKLLTEEVPGVQLLSKSSSCAYSILEGIKEIESEQIRQMNARLVERQDELSHLSVLLDQYQRMAEACKKDMPGTPMVAVFDTAFHQTLPEERYIYPIPYKYYKEYGVRKYGFHGTSHLYVSRRVAELIGKPVEDLKIINCHLGQGASICAIQNGKSVETSMGLTPLGGIPMGSRSGDLDPSVVTFLMEKENLTPAEMNNILNKQSGLYGVSEISPDARDIEPVAWSGGKQAGLALDVYHYLVACYIARCVVAMNGVDVITFTAGTGERGNETREILCDKLKFLGVELDKEANKVKAEERKISSENSKVLVYVVPTEEELMIARETKELIENK